MMLAVFPSHGTAVSRPPQMCDVDPSIETRRGSVAVHRRLRQCLLPGLPEGDPVAQGERVP